MRVQCVDVYVYTCTPCIPFNADVFSEFPGPFWRSNYEAGAQVHGVMKAGMSTRRARMHGYVYINEWLYVQFLCYVRFFSPFFVDPNMYKANEQGTIPGKCHGYAHIQMYACIRAPFIVFLFFEFSGSYIDPIMEPIHICSTARCHETVRKWCVNFNDANICETWTTKKWRFCQRIRNK